MYQYPYGNAQQLNLDWLMEQWQTVKQSIDGSLQGEIDRVEAAMTDLLNARDAAVAAAGAANTSANAAAASAQAAAGDAATAAAQAAAANTARSNAAQAANNAQQYAGNAQTQAAAAQNAAGQAAASANQAAADASDAHDDAVAASGSAVNAAASAAGALQNFQLSDAARQAAQAAEQDAEAAATLLQPPATAADIGKALIVKTVGGGTVTAYELGESGGGGTPAIVNTIEDVPIASFDDGTNNPVQQLVVGIEPAQAGSGDPAPDNIRPITGWTGAIVNVSNKNIIYPKYSDRTAYGITFTINDDGSITANGTATGTAFATSAITNTNLMQYIKAGTYIASGGLSNKKQLNIAGKYIDGQNIPGLYDVGSGKIITLVKDAWVYPQIIISENEVCTNDVFKIQLEKGTIISEFTSHQGITIPITFPSSVGTVYGGTLTNQGSDEWKLIIDRAFGEALISAYTNIYPGTNYDQYVFHSFIPNGVVRDNRQICNIAKYNFTQTDNLHFYLSTSSQTGNGNLYIWLPKNVDTTLQVQAMSFLETPIEYSITNTEAETLLGINNIWADTGNINLVQYYADSKKYIDDQDTFIKALIAPVLDGMVADTALTANDFRIVDNTLYRITAPVAAGAALTPNTNCTATTIGAVLKTLLT